MEGSILRKLTELQNAERLARTRRDRTDDRSGGDLAAQLSAIRVDLHEVSGVGTGND
ncbi:hypothetical protein [Novosphingobium marinum]|uniref:hypothetical protein n=1 Tax=Novosphingobium marinum TaxID=1514948 RepID=UPI00166B0144|nr:hypothetical protein [Novosphingobium marinum]